MLRLLRKYFALYVCGGMALYIAAIIAAMCLSGLSESLALLALVSGFILVLVWAVFCSKRANAYYMRVLRILNEQCDPEGFVEAQRSIYKRACKIKRIRSAVSTSAVVVRMNRAVALSFAGQHNDAIDEVNAILALPARKNKDYYHGMCHINLSMFLARRNEEGDIVAAREHLCKAHEHIKAMGQENAILSGEIIRAEYTLDIAEGKNLEAARDYFCKNADSSSFTRAEAGNRFMLALIYRQLGDTESERAQLEFVAQTAPKAYIGKQAAQRLAELSA